MKDHLSHVERQKLNPCDEFFSRESLMSVRVSSSSACALVRDSRLNLVGCTFLTVAGAPLFELYAIFDLGQFLLKVLAVAGGAAIGFFATGLFLKVAGRFFFRRKGRLPAYNLVRSLGMVAFGFLVYLWAFGAGGAGFGGAGGWWPFGGKGGTVDKEKDVPDRVIQIRFLGGKDVVEQRFYLIDQEKAAKNWDELVSELKKRQQADSRLKALEVVLYQGSIDRENPAVTRLEKWARENRLSSRLIIHGVDGRDGVAEPQER
jgi:hypothetical protein